MHGLKILKKTYTILTVCLICVGAIILFWPQIGLNVMCEIFGVLTIIYGVAKIVGYFSRDLFQLAFQFDFGLGIVSLVIGCLLLFNTQLMLEAFSITIGTFMLVDAALRIQTSIDAKRFGIDKWWLILVISIITAIIGVLLLAVPLETVTVITRIIGLNLLFDGLLNLVVVQSTVRTINREMRNTDLDF